VFASWLPSNQVAIVATVWQWFIFALLLASAFAVLLKVISWSDIGIVLIDCGPICSHKLRKSVL
jgi:hypothetical protein